VSWAAARVICDSPDKKRVVSGARPGQLMSRAVSDATAAVQSEILLVTPYFIPGPEELRALRDLRLRNARVRILTNSLESAASVAAHSGYMRYRTPLLEQGAEIDEVRSQPGSARGSGQTAAMSRYGTYSLHAKLFVFDRRRVFIGSMNFDQRSRHLNTEVGMIIDAPDLAQQTATRFEAMTQPQNSYAVTLLPGRAGHARRLVWRSAENGAPVEYSKEPARSNWQRIKVHLLALVPMSGEL
jgi:putative cardiolipin synthase